MSGDPSLARFAPWRWKAIDREDAKRDDARKPKTFVIASERE